MALLRMFRIREGDLLEFRAEAYNILNSFRPIDPKAQLTSSQFARFARRVIPESCSSR